MNTIILDNLKVLTHDNIPVITTELLANLYGTEVIRIQQNYNRNNSRFIEGKHFFKITGECLNNLRLSFSESQISAKTRSLILWTERGAARHAKMLETDKAWDVFEQLEDCYFNSKKVNNSQPQTKAAERFTHSDTRNLTHLVWCMTNGFRFERSWSNAVWLALREVTGTPSPERFQVEHIPLMADECRRIYYITEALRQIINDAEKQTIKRLLRKRENIDTVLAEIKQLFEQFHHQQIGIITARTDQWYEGELTHFLERH
ncbi:ORF6N domain-containing protein [Arsenophonus nasoniae]|uniref:ORF6N domain-containing protein n=1 Tax=Arsenophonus nasoniae TaxID=638 RepID=A0AA95GM45_9GAMM|nr:ORF6N domain-containing protein [Arsenophonus nasoniae]WGM00056.1 ORF6N domain-containing protein [Arsenophonus nasoniae]